MRIASSFQSTPPVKAATAYALAFQLIEAISIHAAREGGDQQAPSIAKEVAISIHAAREGGDLCAYRRCRTQHHISIHAAREGGDVVTPYDAGAGIISIHAAREGGDCGNE